VWWYWSRLPNDLSVLTDDRSDQQRTDKTLDEMHLVYFLLGSEGDFCLGILIEKRF
jgi:hypothetical protein